MSNREFILSVIEKYRNSPILWQVTHRDYRNKMKRNKALKEFLVLFKAKDKQANLDTVKKKIVSLRSSFMKELNKVRKSIETKSDGDDIHIPKLWYYNEMAFLIDAFPPSSPSPDVKEVVIVKEDKDEMEVRFEILEDDDSLVKIKLQSLEPAIKSYVYRFIKRCIMISDEENQSNVAPPSPVSSNKSYPAIPIIPHIQRTATHSPINYPAAKNPRRTEPSSSLPSSNLKYAAYGEHIAEKLRSMPDLMATYCQKLINDAIFLAETNNLDIHSQILNNHHF